jgi:hypothetical protein
MAFPDITTLLDDFNRANENPLTGWTNSFWTLHAGNLQVFGNEATGIAGNPGTGKTSGDVGPDGCVFQSIPTVTTVDTHQAWLFLRLTGTGATLDGYVGEAQYNSGSDDSWKIYRLDDGTPTQIGSTGSVNLAAGDRMGLRVVGTTLELFHYTGGSWNQTPKVSTTDSTYSAAGKLGFGVDDSTWRADDVSGGTIVAAANGPQNMMLLGVG